jgi:hypothetical protein
MLDMNLIDQIQYVAPDELKNKVASFQPVTRTLKRALRDLLDAIEKKGKVLQPIVISSEDGVIADGHRRLACAIILRLPVIPVRVLEGKAQDLFVELNGPTRAVDKKTWHESVAFGLSPEIVPDVEGKYIRRMIEVLGWEDYQVLALEGTTSFIYKTSERVGRYVSDTSDEYIGKILRWLYNQNMQRPVHEAMRDNAPPEVIRTAIDHNRKLSTNVVWSA